MKTGNKKLAIYLIVAGVLFLIVGIYDVARPAANDRSGFIVALEFVAAIGFFFNALVQARVGKD